MSESREHKATKKLRGVRALSNLLKQEHISVITLSLEPISGTDNYPFAHLQQFLLMYDDVVAVL